jgi:phage-related minor tail protein
MGQGPIQVADINLIPQGAKNAKNFSTPTVIKTTPGTVLGFAVIAAATGAGLTAGTINDCLTTGAVAVGNQTGVIPNTAGDVTLSPGIPHTTGIVVAPPTGGTTNGTIAVWYV